MTGPAILATPLTPDQVAIVDMLKETLSQALEGRFTTIGIAVCMREGYSHAMAGHDAGSLNLAVDKLKGAILDAVENSPKTKAVNKIMRLRG